MLDNYAMQTIVVTGASGFIGQHLLLGLAGKTGVSVRALTRRSREQAIFQPDNKLHWIYGDLADSSTATNLMIPGSTLINLAFPESWPRSAHIENTNHLAAAAAQYGVRRVIHCSTVVVVGNTRQQCVTEATEASPQTDYEKTKLAVEQTWRKYAKGRFDLVIARPSAVFGPGGKNLATLADALMLGSRSVNYVRSVLYSRRRMNLVCVRNVVAAIEVLINQEEPFNGDTFNISNDDDPLNNFRDVERILMRELGIRNYALPHMSAPRFALTSLLRLAGRSNTNPDRVYDSSKLHKIGWCSVCDIEHGLRDFAAWYLSHRRSTLCGY